MSDLGVAGIFKVSTVGCTMVVFVRAGGVTLEFVMFDLPLLDILIGFYWAVSPSQLICVKSPHSLSLHTPAHIAESCRNGYRELDTLSQMLKDRQRFQDSGGRGWPESYIRDKQ